MGCRLLQVVLPAVISALLLWEGIECRAEGYDLTVPSQVTVQDGLCVDIPCTFSYPTSHDDTQAELYGYWYVEGKQGGRARLVATNDPKEEKHIDTKFRNRFEVSRPKLNRGDCTLTIHYAAKADEGAYHFRMEKGHQKYSYSEKAEQSSVIVTEREINITVPGPVRAGQRETIFCKTQICNYREIPKINWLRPFNFSSLEISSSVKHNYVEGRMDFIPKAANHQQNVTCRFTYGEGFTYRTAEKTVMLDVHYPPRMLQFNMHLVHRGDGHKEDRQNVSEVIARAGDSLVVRCEADANPKSTQTWGKLQAKQHSSHIHQPTSNDELHLPNLRQDDSGEYECWANNQEGSSRGILSIRVTGSGTWD
uniref:Uncharacterized protein n=2 Tax=Sphaerodactylus townsendi TaxID=933632 RepID=A0ACB8FSB8_9SAUR